MWTNENRAKYKRDHLRYPSDVTDEEWAHVEPLIPPAKRGGRKREADMREVFNGIMYVLSTGCQWRYLPKDLPPNSTVYRYFCEWSWDGTLDRIHDALYIKCREQAEREASPTAAIIDSQSVKSAEKGGRASIRTATTRARRSRARSAICSSTRKACCRRPSPRRRRHGDDAFLLLAGLGRRLPAHPDRLGIRPRQIRTRNEFPPAFRARLVHQRAAGLPSIGLAAPPAPRGNCRLARGPRSAETT